MSAALFAYLALPDKPTRFEASFYPAIGFVGGAVIIFLLIMTTNLVLAPYRQRNEAREEVLRRTDELQAQIDRLKAQPKLEIVFESGPTFKQVLLDVRSRRKIRGTQTLYRVGIRHDGLGTIDNVSVEIEDMVPSVLPAHLLLHQMHDNAPPEVSRQDFSLDADHTVFIDVVMKQDDNGQPPSHQVIICHIVPGVPQDVPAQRYEIVVLAHGRNANPVRQNFIIDVGTDGALQFAPAWESPSN